MDVICDRCKAEYEFDEALLGDKGTTVKCSACGHVFRVLPPNRDANRSQLKLRLHKDGSVKSLGSLRELQQRIRAGEVSLDDELGRDGFPFRLLRDVPELKNFFMSAPPPDMSAQVERATVRPDASRAAPLPEPPTRVHPSLARGSAPADDRPAPSRSPAFATVARDAGATAVPKGVPTGDTLLGSAPTAHAKGAPGATRAAEPRPAGREPVAAGQPGAGAPTSPESRSRTFSKHTMMGVGPEDLQLPPPPRVPQFGPGAGAGQARSGAAAAERGGGAAGRPAAASPGSRAEEARGAGAGAAGKPGGANPVRERTQPAAQDKTLHGIPVVGPAPSPPGYAGQPAASAKPSAGLPPLKPSVRPASASLDRGGTMTPISAAAAAAVAAEPPQQFSDARSRVEEEPGASTASPSAHDGRPEPAPRRGVAPFDVASSAFPQRESDVQHLPDVEPPLSRVDARNAGAEPAPKLYLDDEDRPPERATESSSKLWLYVALLLLIGGGAYLGVTRFQVLGRATSEPAPVATPEPNAVPDASVAQNPQAAGQPGAGTQEPGATSAPQPEAKAAEFAPPVPGVDPSPGVSGATPPEPAAATSKTNAPGAGEPPTEKPGRHKGPVEAPDAPASAKPASDRPERGARAAADPQDYGGWVSRGDQLFSKGDHDGASKAYKTALALRPTGSEANAGLGFALLNEGHARESLPYFDRASNSGYAEANIGLGDAYRKLGQPSSAKEAYQAYLDRLPSGARANYARSALDKLKGGSGSSDKPADEKPAAAPGAHSDYRPAGELIEPSAPAPSAPAAPASPPPTAPSETPP